MMTGNLAEKSESRPQVTVVITCRDGPPTKALTCTLHMLGGTLSMERFIAGLVKDFEAGKITRRQFGEAVAIATVVYG
jgi:hypothetical protein